MLPDDLYLGVLIMPRLSEEFISACLKMSDSEKSKLYKARKEKQQHTIN